MVRGATVSGGNHHRFAAQLFPQLFQQVNQARVHPHQTAAAAGEFCFSKMGAEPATRLRLVGQQQGQCRQGLRAGHAVGLKPAALLQLLNRAAGAGAEVTVRRAGVEAGNR
jgi:hypothetical protein